jgi:multidrug efflux pump subunit AcrA (membrane-fusion protein)
MMLSHHNRLAAGLIVVMAAVDMLCFLGLAEAQPSETSSERAVTVAQARRMCFANTLQVTGVLVPKKAILVRPDREGMQISQVLIEPGDTVVSGQVLARLIPPEGVPGGSLAVQSPAAGVIFNVSATVGSTASARGMPLFQLAERGEMELIAETPAKTLMSLAPDQAAKVEIIGVGELSGRVRQSSGSINPMTQLGQIRISVPSDPRLRAGAFGRAVISLGQRCGPGVPLSAVLYGAGSAVVQVVRESRVETRPVSVGMVSSGQAEIREGLSEGDMVIARAGSFVRDGDRVHPVTPGATSTRR